MAQVTPAPRGFDLDTDDAALALHTPRFSHTLKNALWELWMNRMATVGAVMIIILLLVSLLAPVLATGSQPRRMGSPDGCLGASRPAAQNGLPLVRCGDSMIQQ